MKKNDFIPVIVTNGDTSALPTVSDSCEASVGKACRRCVSESCLNKKRDEQSSIPI